MRGIIIVAGDMGVLTALSSAILQRSNNETIVVVTDTEEESTFPNKMFKPTMYITPLKTVDMPHPEFHDNPRKDKRKHYTPQPWRDKRSRK